MPRFRPSILFDDCWASVGDITFYHWHGNCYYKKRPYTKFRGTPSQLDQQALHHRAIQAWRSIPHGTQLEWNRLAMSVTPHRPPFDGSAYISGYNLFVSAYHGFAQLGNEHTPEPKPYASFPDFFLDWESLRVVEGRHLQLTFFSSIGPGYPGGRYRLLLKLQLTAPGRGRKPGLQRNFIALQNCPEEDGEVDFIIPDYRDIWGLDLPEYTAHCRFLLLDCETGYRSLERMQSIRFSLL